MQITLKDFAAGMFQLKDTIEKDPRRRTFGGFVYFSDLVLGAFIYPRLA
jgi:hypothetical protein